MHPEVDEPLTERFPDELVDGGVPGPVEVLHWNPERQRFDGRVGRRLPLRKLVNNFGDMLGPEIVRRLVREHHDVPTTGGSARRTARLVSVGSVLHFARPGDVVWGTGVNARIPEDWYRSEGLDVRAVRGPLTADFLAGRGYRRPTVFGDPALLVPALMPELLPGPSATRDDYCIVPNLHDRPSFGRDRHVLDPRRPWQECIARIARAKAVFASSLHGLIIAEALRIPIVHLTSGTEPDFKYRDYALGCGSAPLPTAPSMEAARALAPRLRDDFDPRGDELMDAFPDDLWR